jgi:hypothetical protein
MGSPRGPVNVTTAPRQSGQPFGRCASTGTAINAAIASSNATIRAVCLTTSGLLLRYY